MACPADRFRPAPDADDGLELWAPSDLEPVTAPAASFAEGQVTAGLPHAGQIVTIELGGTALRVIDSNGELLSTVPRNSTGEISRFKAHGTRQSR
jgi:hypothetical protein